MWAATTIPPSSLSIFHIKSICNGQSSLGRQFTTPTSIIVLEGKQSHLDRFKGNICRAGIGDCLDKSQIQADNAAIVGEQPKARILDDHKKRGLIEHIRWMLSTIDDGRISISPYDTAWVALLENTDDSGSPQFPSSLEWIAQNQLSDGSWGDEHEYSVYDRLLNTLACVIALRSWNIHPDNSERGIRFLKEISKELESTNLDSLTCGFEIIFPPLLERARKLGIEIPYDGPFLREIFALRDQKFARIPKDHMLEVPTPILYNLEGIEDLNWEKLLKLQTEEGSFLTSPSATAFAFMQTGDQNCLKYLNNIVKKFNGGAPTVYPIDLFARLWAVDRLQRLGISHHFEEQIMECLSYVHRYWTANGVFSGRKATVFDLDDTSMGFRLLRLQGYNVTPDAFKNFKSNDKFYCLGGELNASPTTLLNLYKASQVRFPGEDILEDAQNFSYNFLKERILDNEIVDKWVRSKDIVGELKFGLEIPWSAWLPCVEARFYIEQYSGADDVWIGKTFYRVAEISNNHYLEVAKLDFNECQIQHQLEWTNMLKWWKKFNLEEYGLRRENLLLTYFLAAASIFEPGRSAVRFAWAKSWAIIKILGFYFDKIATSRDKRNAFLAAFKGDANGRPDKLDEMGKILQWIIQDFLYQLSIDAFQGQQRDIRQQLTNMWETWLIESLDVQNGIPHEGALLAHIINLCAGNVRISSVLLSDDEESKHLCHLTNKVCLQLRHHQEKGTKTGKPERNMGGINSLEIDTSMQELLQLVVQIKSSNIINQNAKKTFLSVAKAFYYAAYCDKETINIHIAKVLFEPLL